jgi:zinc transporter ZupT
MLKKDHLHIHEHEDHLHVHEHYHGEKDNIKVTTIGLVIHSLADGFSLGASLYCNYCSYNLI